MFCNRVALRIMASFSFFASQYSAATWDIQACNNIWNLTARLSKKSICPNFLKYLWKCQVKWMDITQYPNRLGSDLSLWQEVWRVLIIIIQLTLRIMFVNYKIRSEIVLVRNAGSVNSSKKYTRKCRLIQMLCFMKNIPRNNCELSELVLSSEYHMVEYFH